MIRFEAPLLRPLTPGKTASWSFVQVPADASAKLPSRGIVAVDGSLNGHPFKLMFEPDGKRGHWFKVDKALRQAAGVAVGDLLVLEITPATEEPEAKVPTDLRSALATADPTARTVWSEITPAARRDWIHWITSAKRPETRERRIRNACEMLGSGKRRVCCFDRSGVYGKGLAAPEAADP